MNSVSRRVALVVHPKRAAASELAEKTRTWWEERGYSVVIDHGLGTPALGSEDLDFAVSLGGDGTMLRTVQLVLERGVPVLGVNFGNLGYLTQVEPAGLPAALDRLLAGEYEIEERMTLELSISTGSQTRTLVALNEVVLEKDGPGHTVHVAVSIKDRPFLTYVADGMIVATPTGSTAYNLSARGPIVSPSLRSIVMTPISPHMLFDRSLVLEPDEAVGLQLLDGRAAVLSVDGSMLVPVTIEDRVRIVAGPAPARIVRFGRPDFHAILRAKFGLADR